MRIRGANSSWVPHPAGPGLSRSLPSLRVFFDSCDGFFTNYNWREDHLQRMVAQAGERLADVYVGVDVFARSNVVGGRFDTDKVGGGLHFRAAGLHALCGLYLGALPFSKYLKGNQGTLDPSCVSPSHSSSHTQGFCPHSRIISHRHRLLPGPGAHALEHMSDLSCHSADMGGLREAIVGGGEANGLRERRSGRGESRFRSYLSVLLLPWVQGSQS